MQQSRMTMGRPVIINKINVTSSRPEIIIQNCLTVVLEHMEGTAQCQKQPEDTGEEKYDAEMLT
jgi:hypothetical protein